MIFLALVIGIVAGLRAMLAPAAIAWAATMGRLPLAHTMLSFMAWRFTPWIFSVLAAGELVTDQLPSTPSRKVPTQFGGRLLTGGLSGAAVGYSQHAPLSGLALGIVGAVIGTIGGAAVRARLSAGLNSDHIAAAIEDGVAIAGAAAVFAML